MSIRKRFEYLLQYRLIEAMSLSIQRKNHSFPVIPTPTT
jgi:hypothetical protein